MRLPVISGRTLEKTLRKDGWVLARWRGSHMIFTKEGEEATLSVPDHKELGRGLLRSLLRDARITAEEFSELLD